MFPARCSANAWGDSKPVFLNSFYVQRGLWFLIVLVPIWILTHPSFLSPGSALTCFLWLLFAAHASGSVGVPSYLSWMGDVVPSRIKGNYFARRRQLGNLTALPAAVFVGWLLDRQAGNSNLRDPHHLRDPVWMFRRLRINRHPPVSVRPTDAATERSDWVM